MNVCVPVNLVVADTATNAAVKTVVVPIATVKNEVV